MAKKQDLQNEINELTDKIRKNMPATYKHLMETPDTIPNAQNEDNDNFEKLLEDYRDQLVEILKKDD